MAIKNRSVLAYISKVALDSFNYDSIDRLQFVKILYMIESKMNQNGVGTLTDYEFIKARLGPYSSDIVNDLEKLVDIGVIEPGEKYYEYTLGDIPEEIQKEIDEIQILIQENGMSGELEEIFDLGRNTSDILDEVESLDVVENTERGDPVELY